MSPLKILYYIGLAVIVYSLIYSLYLSRKLKHSKENDGNSKYTHPIYREYASEMVQLILSLIIILLGIFYIFDRPSLSGKKGLESGIIIAILFIAIFVYNVRRFAKK